MLKAKIRFVGITPFCWCVLLYHFEQRTYLFFQDSHDRSTWKHVTENCLSHFSLDNFNVNGSVLANGAMNVSVVLQTISLDDKRPACEKGITTLVCIYSLRLAFVWRYVDKACLHFYFSKPSIFLICIIINLSLLPYQIFCLYVITNRINSLVYEFN